MKVINFQYLFKMLLYSAIPIGGAAIAVMASAIGVDKIKRESISEDAIGQFRAKPEAGYMVHLTDYGSDTVAGLPDESKALGLVDTVSPAKRKKTPVKKTVKEKKGAPVKMRSSEIKKGRKKKKPPPEGMVWIEGGMYAMGSEEGEDDEKPVHTVTINGFYMDRTEVTQEEYKRVMGENPSSYSKKCPQCPVETVSWHDAVAYCKKVGKRLPTEAEWEYAARAGGRGKYFWGDDRNRACSYANVADRSAKKKFSDWNVVDCDDGYAEMAPVGSFKANRYGLYDMTGNVWEWCNDWYNSNYYTKSPVKNPRGPDSGSYRVVRGGSWDFNSGIMRCSVRNWYLPFRSNRLVGFRCAR